MESAGTVEAAGAVEAAGSVEAGLLSAGTGIGTPGTSELEAGGGAWLGELITGTEELAGNVSLGEGSAAIVV